MCLLARDIQAQHSEVLKFIMGLCLGPSQGPFRGGFGFLFSSNMSFQGWDLERSHITTIEVYSGCVPSEFSDETWCVHHPG